MAITDWTLHAPAPLALHLGLPIVGGFLSSLTMGNSVKTWYKTQLKKPWFTPPSRAFPIVWTCLYASMGYASHRIFFLTPSQDLSLPIGLYAFQLALNFAWTPLFFKFQRFGLALIDIATLFGSIAATSIVFYQHDQLAGLLLLPYLSWVGYASLLNYSIWKNNPGFRYAQLRKP